ncbi:MAG: hypothetical protein D6775_00975 [Caldilineae bacterium]|nr:MAG: hypothetical protein D6775_00975 [Caldilineae bacterium]
MTVAAVTLAVLAVILLFLAWRRGDNSHREGVWQAVQTLRRTLPLLIAAFLIVGYVNVLEPQQLVQRFIGPQSGWGGILLAEGIGMLLPGGPYVVFPLIAALYKAGAGLGPAVTLVTSWATQGLISVSFELSFMGWRFSAVRWGLGLVVPLLAGGLVHLLT